MYLVVDQMIRYKEYFSEINSDFDLDKHIEQLLELGYRINEIMEMLKVEDQQIVNVLDQFAKEQTNKMRFNETMERLGYEYEREETKTLFG